MFYAQVLLEVTQCVCIAVLGISPVTAVVTAYKQLKQKASTVSDLQRIFVASPPIPCEANDSQQTDGRVCLSWKKEKQFATTVFFFSDSWRDTHR